MGTIVTTNLKTNVEAKITALTGSEAIKELLLLQKSSDGLDCSNQIDLDDAIAAIIVSQTTSTDVKDLLLANKAATPDTSRVVTTTVAHTVSSSNASYPVPDGAVSLKVTAGAAGGAGDGWGGGAGGAWVINHPLSLPPSGYINIVVGNQITVDYLVIGQGESSTSIDDAVGGRVTEYGVGISGSTVFNGGDADGDVGGSSHGGAGAAGNQDATRAGTGAGQYNSIVGDHTDVGLEFTIEEVVYD